MFGAELKAVLTAKGIRQKELCEMCGLSQQMVSLYIKEKCRPSRKNIDLITDSLGLERGYFDKDSHVDLDECRIELMTVAECSRIWGVSESTIQAGLIQEKFSWGYAIKTSSEYRYLINRKKFIKTEIEI